MKHWLTVDSFYRQAPKMRGHFEDNFRDPRQAGPQRFVWDFWYVPDQYRLVRTPAYHYFPGALYQDFHSSLVQWGRENLGCHDVSPPWLSYYVNGCRQELHADVPHGPWAFVYSLSPKRVKYQGGETIILKPETLSYWNGFTADKGHESVHFADKVKSPFNRLTVFDPRFPHGVSEVKGVEDPLDARLVIHGWFVEPRPYVVGPLTTKQVGRTLDDALGLLGEALAQEGDFHGTVSFRLNVTPAGRISEFRWLTDTLMGLFDQAGQRARMIPFLKRAFSGLQFPKAKGSSRITVPLIFKT